MHESKYLILPGKSMSRRGQWPLHPGLPSVPGTDSPRGLRVLGLSPGHTTFAGLVTSTGHTTNLDYSFIKIGSKFLPTRLWGEFDGGGTCP